jgi:uncharacterized protein with HEPN domain
MNPGPRRDRIGDMPDAARTLGRITAGKTPRDLETDTALALATVRPVEVVGEAATHVDERTRAIVAGIPRQQNIGARNRLIHACVEVDLDLVWSTVANDLQPLVDGLESIRARTAGGAGGR